MTINTLNQLQPLAQTLWNGTSRFVSFCIDHPGFSIPLAGGLTAGCFTTYPVWVGVAAGVGFYSTATLVQEKITKRFFKTQPPSSLEERSSSSSSSSSSFSKINNFNNGLDQNKALKKTLKVSLNSQKCPISQKTIPEDQKILINGVFYNINHFVMGVLALDRELPLNPMNRSPLTDDELETICKHFNIDKEEFKNLFSKTSSVRIIADGKQEAEISNLIALASDEEQVTRLVEIQNNSSDEIRDARKEAFVQLIYSKNNDSNLQGFFLDFPDLIGKIIKLKS